MSVGCQDNESKRHQQPLSQPVSAFLSLSLPQPAPSAQAPLYRVEVGVDGGVVRADAGARVRGSPILGRAKGRRGTGCARGLR